MSKDKTWPKVKWEAYLVLHDALTEHPELAGELLEYLEEAAKPPYKDSDVKSLHKTLSCRAKFLIEKITE